MWEIPFRPFCLCVCMELCMVWDMSRSRTMHIFREPKCIRSPGYFEINWSRFSFELALIYDSSRDYDERWPWMLHFHFLWLNVYLHFPGPDLNYDTSGLNWLQ